MKLVLGWCGSGGRLDLIIINHPVAPSAHLHPCAIRHPIVQGAAAARPALYLPHLLHMHSVSVADVLLLQVGLGVALVADTGTVHI